MSAIETLRKGLELKSIVKYRGQSIDTYSASAIISVYDRLSEEAREKFEPMIERDLIHAASIAFKTIERANKKASN